VPPPKEQENNVRTAPALALACALALAGCAQLASLETHGNPNKATVSVAAGQIGVDPDPINVPAGNNAPIIWTLAPDTPYKFFAGSITFTDAGGEFYDCQVENPNDPRGFVCKNKHSKPGRYKYVIKLRDANGNEISKDPFIVNG
jgi:hypothetical protein